MVTVSVLVARYDISMPYLASLAGEFGGRILSAHDKGEDRTVEVGFEVSPASSNAKAFRSVLDSSFLRPHADEAGDGV